MLRFPLDVLLAWGLINIIPLFVVVIFCAGESNVIFVPIWRIIWGVIPLNLAGRIITCVISAILFLPTDLCFFGLIVIMRLLRHIGYAWWWIFAVNRNTVLHKWKLFWADRDIYFNYWDEFDSVGNSDEDF